ncbi:claudin-11b [Hoplias malabaricus]|uniref:claudin-11b n=1 Tax=Hoplias malabaricus TaxID=27720 RepID=UPI0034632D31
MSQGGRVLAGGVLGCFGWLGIIVASCTNDWVMTCKYEMHTCKKLDELESKGLWAECVVSTSRYHCVALNQILALPAHVQVARALMLSASLLGLLSVLLALLASPCVTLNDERAGTKRKRAVLSGALMLTMAVFGIVATIWFPIGTHNQDGLMTFGFSLYAGWLGSVLCLLAGSIMTCCSGGVIPPKHPENRFYYTKHTSLSNSIQASNNHAKSAHV